MNFVERTTAIRQAICGAILVALIAGLAIWGTPL